MSFVKKVCKKPSVGVASKCQTCQSPVPQAKQVLLFVDFQRPTFGSQIDLLLHIMEGLSVEGTNVF